MEGRIKHANSQGYGFISTEMRVDFYFHHTQYKGDWKKLLQKHVSGEMLIVEFENDPNAPSGPRALNVILKGSVGNG